MIRFIKDERSHFHPVDRILHAILCTDSDNGKRGFLIKYRDYTDEIAETFVLMKDGEAVFGKH